MLEKRNGFTLVELLVVIAIISILASLIFPVVAQAKTKSKETVDISNMRQIYVAHTMYEDDYDGGKPSSLFDLEPIVRSKEVFRSPLDKVSHGFSDGWPRRPFIPWDKERSEFRISYAYLGTYPPFDEGLDDWREKRQNPEIGLIATPWAGAAGPTFPGFEVAMGPLMDGPILRINMDGSFYRLPQNHCKDVMGSLYDLFYYR